MIIDLMSDLHLEHCLEYYQIPEISDGDILILAGDITVFSCIDLGYTKAFEITDKFFRKCSSKYNSVLYVLGNHEHYYSDITNTTVNSALSKHISGNFKNVKLIDKEVIDINKKWSVIGATLWTSLNNKNPMAMLSASQMLNDYKKIYYNDLPLTADNTVSMHDIDFGWIKNTCENLHNKNLIVVSHHSPSTRSIPPRFSKSELNWAYSNNYDDFILDNPNIKYWLHGHTHNKFDYMIGNCNVVCNPRGYVSFEETEGYFKHRIII